MGAKRDCTDSKQIYEDLSPKLSYEMQSKLHLRMQQSEIIQKQSGLEDQLRLKKRYE